MAKVEPMTTELPPEILFSNILPRLPTKSLSRFKSVSKQWHSFLRTPVFIRMHQLHVSNQNHRKFLFLPTARPWEYRTIDCETPEDGFTATRPFPFKVGAGEKISIITSLHGMICVGIIRRWPNDDEYSDLILWNPVTGDHKTFPKAGCYKNYSDIFELFYSSSEDDYKLVWINCGQNVYIFSLKSDSWRMMESTTNTCVPYHLMSSEKFKLFGFEGRENLISFGDEQRPTTDFMGFVVLRKCIHFCVGIINSKGEYNTIGLWKMSGHTQYRRPERVRSSSPDPVVIQLLMNGQQPLHLMRNGNWVVYCRGQECVYVLDTKMHTKDIVCSICYAFMPGGEYIETFVSPNQYIK